MKLINFKISAENIGIEDSKGTYFDLHNNFDFVEFKYEFKERYFEISWNKSIGDWIKSDEAASIKLSFINVSFLRIKELDQEEIDNFKEDDKTLSLIGYSPMTDSDMESYLAIKEDKNGEFAILIQSENGQAFLIYAQEVYAHIKY